MNLIADESIPRHQIPNRLTSVERRLTKLFSENQKLVACVGNIGTGKSSLVKYLAFNTGMNALFELPDEGFEDYIPGNPAIYHLLNTSKDSAKRTLGTYYGAINNFLEAHKTHPVESPGWMHAKQSLEKSALDIQHAYLDLRKMQLQSAPHLKGSTCIDGSPLADRHAFCEVLHNDMEIPFLSAHGLQKIEERLKRDFDPLKKPDLMILLHGPVEMLLDNIRERERKEELKSGEKQELPEGLVRLVRALNQRYGAFTDVLQRNNSYTGPVLNIDVSKIDFVSNVRHLIAVFEGIETLLPS
ncbi:MAG: deoxynucleoside kinase [Deltaproteobacteria bacterium]|nr:deoxynucleoside kinase [Deltaproteobacteria bacterium]